MLNYCSKSAIFVQLFDSTVSCFQRIPLFRTHHENMSLCVCVGGGGVGGGGDGGGGALYYTVILKRTGYT